MSKRTDAIEKVFEDMERVTKADLIEFSELIEILDGSKYNYAHVGMLKTIRKSLTPKTFYIWHNSIYSNEETLDKDLYLHYNKDTDSSNTIDSRVSDAYDNGTVDKVELTYGEFIKHLEDYHYVG